MHTLINHLAEVLAGQVLNGCLEFQSLPILYKPLSTLLTSITNSETASSTSSAAKIYPFLSL